MTLKIIWSSMTLIRELPDIFLDKNFCSYKKK